MNDPEKRICPFCAEAIKAAAKLCPHCRQWLTWKSFRHPLVMLVTHLVPLLGLWVVMMVAGFSLLDEFQNPKPYYSGFPNALQIVESRMNWARADKGPCIYLTGVLTNTSPVAWRDVEFDCRFYDAAGVLVDAGTGHSYFTACSNDNTAFRVSISPTAPTNMYASFKISVANARNAKAGY
jgi:predicted nucleic acid-binding Zn ribbon protein